LCLFDRVGPCANAVKDAQRTKTHDDTRRSLSILWAPRGHEEHCERAAAWYRELLARAGATTGDGSWIWAPPGDESRAPVEGAPPST
jgi:hypothetical protein